MKTPLFWIVISLLFSQNSFGTTYNVKDFGARGDGFTDDTKAVQSIINLAASKNDGSVVYFPAGIYLFREITKSATYLENYILLLPSNITIRGEGENSILKIDDHLFDKNDLHANAHLFKGIRVKDLVVKDLVIDLNGGNNLVPPNSNKNAMAFLVFGGSNVSFENILIKNCAGQNMVAFRDGGNGLKITGSRFFNGGHYVGTSTENKYQVDFSFLYSEWEQTEISNNIIKQEDIPLALTGFSGGIEIHHSWSVVKNNIITGCYPAMYIASTYGVLENVLIDSNEFKECVKGISFWCADSIKKVTISNNTFALRGSSNPNVIVSGIEVPNGNTIIVTKENANMAPIVNLQISANSIVSLLPVDTKEKSVGLSLHSVHEGIIENNIISNCNLAGISFSGSKWGTKNCMVSMNTIKDNNPNVDPAAAASNIMVTDTYSSEVRNAPGFNNLQFAKNNIRGKGAANLPASASKNLLGIFIAVPEKSGKGIKLEDNKLEGIFKEKKVMVTTQVNY